MKRATVGEVQHNFSEILRAVSAGEEVQVIRRKRIVARIVPDSDGQEPRYPDFAARAREVFGQPAGAKLSELVDQDRGERI